MPITESSTALLSDDEFGIPTAMNSRRNGHPSRAAARLNYCSHSWEVDQTNPIVIFVVTSEGLAGQIIRRGQQYLALIFLNLSLTAARDMS